MLKRRKKQNLGHIKRVTWFDLMSTQKIVYIFTPHFDKNVMEKKN